MAIHEIITVNDYIQEVKDDIGSPTTSSFFKKMQACKSTTVDLEEHLEKDREGLHSLKKALKRVYHQGQAFVSAEQELSNTLNQFGSSGWCPEDSALQMACRKFACIIDEHSQLLQTLITTQKNNMFHPLDSALKTELKGVKGDLRRPFEKAAKDYDAKYAKLEKELKQQGKDSGMVRDIEAQDVAEDLSREKKIFQLQMCEFLIKVNSIKTRKGVDFLQKLVEYYHAYCKYFEEGMKTWAHFGIYVSELSSKLKDARHKQEDERKKLNETKTLIEKSLSTEDLEHESASVGPGSSGYTLHPPTGNKIHGTAKTGYLYKKPEGKVLRKVWQKRKCEVLDGKLLIRHSDEAKAPVTIPLLTCKVKPLPEEKKCFDIVSYNRTYHLMGEDEADTTAWISVLLNSKDNALKEAFSEGSSRTPYDSGFREIQQRLSSYVLTLPGNEKCCDCGGSDDVTWLSTNYGILVCIECSGIHRDLGVHISKIQSLTLDKVGTSQLLLARHVSNSFFNEVAESAASKKPTSSSSMEERREFIQSKYVSKKFVSDVKYSSEALSTMLKEAIHRQDLRALLKAYFQGAKLDENLTALNESALHLAIYQEDGSLLPLVDFLIQNSSSVDRQTKEGNTPLHYCIIYNRVECLRLLLRIGANPNIDNDNGKTPVDVAQERNCFAMLDLLRHAQQQKKNMFENVEYAWNLSDDNMTDVSDDEKFTHDNSTPEKRARPTSLSGDRIYTTSPRLLRAEHRASHIPTSGLSSAGAVNYLDFSERKTNSTYLADSMEHFYNANKDEIHLPAGLLNKGNLSGSLRKRPAPYPPNLGSSASSISSARFFVPPPPPHQTSHRRTPSDSVKEEPPAVSSSGPFSGSMNAATAAVTTQGFGATTEAMKKSPSSDSASPGQSPLTNASTSSSPQESHVTLINGKSSESLSSLVSEGDHSQRRLIEPADGRQKPRRCRALYDCEADMEDELSFKEGEIIYILEEETEDGDWIEGMVEGEPSRAGKVPLNFVHMLSD